MEPVIFFQYAEIFLPSLFVANIAAITLTVAGINGMHEIAERTFKCRNSQGPVKNNDGEFNIEFKILESTTIVILFFILSESIIVSPYMRTDVFGIPELVLGSNAIFSITIYAIISFLIGVFSIFIVYCYLLYRGRKKIKNKKDNQIFLNKIHKNYEEVKNKGLLDTNP